MTRHQGCASENFTQSEHPKLTRWLKAYVIVVSILAAIYNVMLFVALGVGDPALGADGLRHKPTLILWLSLIAIVTAIWLVIDAGLSGSFRSGRAAELTRLRLVSEILLVSRLAVLTLPNVVLLTSSRTLELDNPWVDIGFFGAPVVLPLLAIVLAWSSWRRAPE